MTYFRFVFHESEYQSQNHHYVPRSNVQASDKRSLNPFGPNGEKERRLLILKGGELIVILKLYIRADEDGWLISSAFCDFLLNESQVAIICGDHFHVGEMTTHSFRSHPLGD